MPLRGLRKALSAAETPVADAGQRATKERELQARDPAELSKIPSIRRSWSVLACVLFSR
jgi:hypothetical protein